MLAVSPVDIKYWPPILAGVFAFTVGMIYLAVAMTLSIAMILGALELGMLLNVEMIKGAILACTMLVTIAAFRHAVKQIRGGLLGWDVRL